MSPRRRPHPARGARWLTTGLAVSGTLGIATYLQVQDATSDSVRTTGDLAAAAAATTTTIPIPAAPQATIVPSTTPATAAPTTAAPVTSPPVTSPPVTAPRVTVPPVQATTRGSNG